MHMYKSIAVFLLALMMALPVICTAAGETGEKKTVTVTAVRSKVSLSDLDLSEYTDEELQEASARIEAELNSRVKSMLVLSETDVAIAKGRTRRIRAQVKDLPKGVRLSKTTWESSDPQIATVQNGNISGVKGGKTTVTCTALLSDGTELVQECHVQITVAIQRLTISQNDITLRVGSSDLIRAVITPEEATNKTLKYESSDPDTVSVGSSGYIRALKGGKATITVTTTDGSRKSAKLSVYAPSISTSMDTYNCTTKAGIRFTIGYYGKKDNLTVTSNNDGYANVTHTLTGSNLTFQVMPLQAGQFSIAIGDKADAKSKADIQVIIADSAVFNLNSYPEIDYAAANADEASYMDKKCYFTGKVLEVMESTNSNTYRITSSENGEDVVYVTINASDLLDPILENDVVTVYGSYNGNLSYYNVSGQEISLVKVTAERITAAEAETATEEGEAGAEEAQAE